MTAADRIYAALGPFAEDDETGDLRAYIEALTSPLEILHQLLSEDNQDHPWQILTDPDRCPDALLPWLAQWDGVVLEDGMTAAEQRTAVKARAGLARGRISTIRERIERVLTGNKRIIIHERTPGPYDLYIRTIASETPNPDEVLRAIRDQKPAGIVLDYDAATGITYIDLAANYATYGDLAATGMSYQELSETLP